MSNTLLVGEGIENPNLPGITYISLCDFAQFLELSYRGPNDLKGFERVILNINDPRDFVLKFIANNFSGEIVCRVSEQFMLPEPTSKVQFMEIKDFGLKGELYPSEIH